MSKFSIEQRIDLTGGDFIIFKSEASSMILKAIYYRQLLKGDPIPHAFAFNKMDLLKLGETGSFGTTSRTVESDNFYQRNMNSKITLKFTFLAGSGNILIDRVYYRMKGKHTPTVELMDERINKKILDALRIQRANIKLQYTDFNNIFKDLTERGFNEDVAKAICFRIGTAKEETRRLILTTLHNDPDKLMSVLSSNKILDPTKFVIDLFFMRNTEVIRVIPKLKGVNIITIKDLQTHLMLSDGVLTNIMGVGPKNSERILSEVKPFLDYC